MSASIFCTFARRSLFSFCTAAVCASTAMRARADEAINSAQRSAASLLLLVRGLYANTNAVADLHLTQTATVHHAFAVLNDLGAAVGVLDLKNRAAHSSPPTMRRCRPRSCSANA